MHLRSVRGRRLLRNSSAVLSTEKAEDDFHFFYLNPMGNTLCGFSGPPGFSTMCLSSGVLYANSSTISDALLVSSLQNLARLTRSQSKEALIHVLGQALLVSSLQNWRVNYSGRLLGVTVQKNIGGDVVIY
jgi:hypothetical protein